MTRPCPILITLLLTAATVTPSAAHSLSELEGMLGDREKYFQPIDREAPDFALEVAEGGTVALNDLRGKVVVLHFIYTNCPDVCPLHAERIAEIQAMVNRTPMQELVRRAPAPPRSTTGPSRAAARDSTEPSWLVPAAAP